MNFKWLGFLFCAISFPAMVIWKRLWPNLPPPDVYACAEWFFHCWKDFVVEAVRFDAQWWTKAGAFVVLTLFVLNIVQFIGRRR